MGDGRGEVEVGAAAAAGVGGVDPLSVSMTSFGTASGIEEAPPVSASGFASGSAAPVTAAEAEVVAGDDDASAREASAGGRLMSAANVSGAARDGGSGGGSGGMAAESAGVIVRVEVGAVAPGKYQPRRHFDEGKLAQLAESIRSAGVMQPVLVRPAPAEDAATGVRWELIAGERRWRAARLAGLAWVPAVVADLSDEQAAEWGLIENVQREDLGPMERAEAFATLVNAFGMTHAQVAERVGVDRATVTNFLRLRELEEPLQRLLSEGALSVGHAKALLTVRPGQGRERLGRHAVAQGWSVRRMEQAVGADALAIAAVGATGEEAEAIREAQTRARAKMQQVARLEDALMQKLGTKVTIRTDSTGKRGAIEVKFYDLDQFEGLLKALGVERS
jgi:ParB family chromosome partitioning protein